MNIEQEVAKIFRAEGIKRTSEEILARVGGRLSSSAGIVLVELKNNGDITCHYSTNPIIALYGLRIAEQLLVDKRLENLEIVDSDEEEENDG